jgi:hypothetical protein
MLCVALFYVPLDSGLALQPLTYFTVLIFSLFVLYVDFLVLCMVHPRLY